MKNIIQSSLKLSLSLTVAFGLSQSFSSEAKAGLCESNREVLNKAQANLTSLEKLFGQGAVSKVTVLQAEKQLLDLKLCQNSEDQNAFAALVTNTRARKAILTELLKSGLSVNALDAVLIDGEIASLTNACEPYKAAILERYKGGEKTQAAVDTINQACATLGK